MYRLLSDWLPGLATAALFDGHSLDRVEAAGSAVESLDVGYGVGSSHLRRAERSLGVTRRDSTKRTVRADHLAN
jgi:hypothetical protein